LVLPATQQEKSQIANLLAFQSVNTSKLQAALISPHPSPPQPETFARTHVLNCHGICSIGCHQAMTKFDELWHRQHAQLVMFE
jgi:hypothetical protein